MERQGGGVGIAPTAPNVCMPMKSDSPKSRVEFWDGVRAEIPHFLHFIENYEIPENLQESRFGIKAFQHPDLVEILKEMTHENRLMALMEIIVSEEKRQVASCARARVSTRIITWHTCMCCANNFH